MSLDAQVVTVDKDAFAQLQWFLPALADWRRQVWLLSLLFDHIPLRLLQHDLHVFEEYLETTAGPECGC